jgi:putative addiction module component (TIGR02574 family)
MKDGVILTPAVRGRKQADAGDFRQASLFFLDLARGRIVTPCEKLFRSWENIMSPQLSQLTDQALALPEDERLILAEVLWASVEPSQGGLEVDDELIAEIDRREAEVASGAVKPIPYEQAMREIRESLR